METCATAESCRRAAARRVSAVQVVLLDVKLCRFQALYPRMSRLKAWRALCPSSCRRFREPCCRSRIQRILRASRNPKVAARRSQPWTPLQNAAFSWDPQGTELSCTGRPYSGLPWQTLELTPIPKRMLRRACGAAWCMVLKAEAQAMSLDMP